jgi:hypothetical protein
VPENVGNGILLELGLFLLSNALICLYLHRTQQGLGRQTFAIALDLETYPVAALGAGKADKDGALDPYNGDVRLLTYREGGSPEPVVMDLHTATSHKGADPWSPASAEAGSRRRNGTLSPRRVLALIVANCFKLSIASTASIPETRRTTI